MRYLFNIYSKQIYYLKRVKPCLFMVIDSGAKSQQKAQILFCLFWHCFGKKLIKLRCCRVEHWGGQNTPNQCALGQCFKYLKFFFWMSSPLTVLKEGKTDYLTLCESEQHWSLTVNSLIYFFCTQPHQCNPKEANTEIMVYCASAVCNS